MHADLDLDQLPEEAVDAATAAMFRNLIETGRGAEVFERMSDTERQLVQAAILRHERRLEAGTAPTLAIPAAGESGLVPVDEHAAAAALAELDNDDEDSHDPYDPDSEDYVPAVDPVGATFLDLDEQRAGRQGRYADYSRIPHGEHAGGRSLEIGDNDDALAEHFTREQWADVVAMLRAAAYRGERDAAVTDDREVGLALSENPDDPAYTDVTLTDEAGDEVAVPFAGADLVRLADGTAADLLAETLEAVDGSAEWIDVRGHNYVVHLVRLPDGRTLVHKTARLTDDADDAEREWARRMVDAEELAAMVSTAVATAPTARVSRDYVRNPHEAWFEHVPGDRVHDLEQLGADERTAFGLLDVILGNQSRQVMRRDDDGTAVGIDHAEAWPLHITPDPARPFTRQPGAPMAVFVAGDDYVAVPPVDPADLEQARGRLESLRDEFDARGRGEWLDYSLGVVDELLARCRPAAKPVRIPSDDGADVQVTHYPKVVRIDLAHHHDEPDPDAPAVLLDDAGAEALAAAAAAMADAEKEAARRWRDMEKRRAKLEGRREQIEAGRYGDNAGTIIELSDKGSALLGRMDALWSRRRERLEHLADADRARFDELDAAYFTARDAGDAAGMAAARAAQRRIVYGMTDDEIAEYRDLRTDRDRRRELAERPGGMDDGGFGRRALHDRDQDEWDRLSTQYQGIKREISLRTGDARDLTPEEQAELADVNRRIDDLDTAMGEFVDSAVIASGSIPAADGGTLVWETTGTDDGAVRHSMDRRPPDAGDDWTIDAGGYEIPYLSTEQVAKVAKAAKTPGQARPTPAPAVPPPTRK